MADAATILAAIFSGTATLLGTFAVIRSKRNDDRIRIATAAEELRHTMVQNHLAEQDARLGRIPTTSQWNAKLRTIEMHSGLTPTEPFATLPTVAPRIPPVTKEETEDADEEDRTTPAPGGDRRRRR